jgi:integrase/recombinase XerD
MASNGLTSTTTISVLTRHSKECPRRDDPHWKRCKCRKSLYIYEAGKVSYVSARTRSWEQAEKLAQAERDKRDPVKIELARIAAEEAVKKAAALAKETSIEAALDQWIAGFKAKKENAKAYETFKRFLMSWAESQGFTMLSEVTSDALDGWVGSWTLAPNTQKFRLSRVRSLFEWAYNLRKLEHNPAAVLRSIRAENEEETQPLTAVQFKAVIAATYKYDEEPLINKDRFGADLRAVFLVMRWTGVRLVDALMLRRYGVKGNRLSMDIQKTGDHIDRVVPEDLIEALKAVPIRKRMHPDQFFWSRECDHRALVNTWLPRIKALNAYLSLKNDDGEPMEFRSHMLRDTFAVELLLAGMKLEDVSKLLGHRNTRTTEKHYAPWVKARQRKLEDEMMTAMRLMGANFAGD